MGVLSDNLPIGAENDPLAPFNEPEPVKYKRFVSVSLSFDKEFMGSPGLSEDQIKDIIQDEFEDIINNYIDSKVYIDEFEVIDE